MNTIPSTTTRAPSFLPAPTELPRVGTRVSFVGDSRVTGTVVGHGTVDAAADPANTTDATYAVAIVALDVPLHAEMPGALAFFHTPIDPSVLRPIA